MEMSRFTSAAAAFIAALVLTSAQAAPSDYAKRLTVTVNPAIVGYATSDAADVPVAVRLSESIAGFSYSDFLMENGGDILFTDESGNALPHEIETWNPQGESIVWVRVPKFGAGRRFYAYYGGEAVAQNAAAVWSGYTGVWHMSEASGTVADATGNGLSATPAGDNTAQSVATAGPVANARINATGGTSNYLNVPYSSTLDLGDALTFSGWVKASQIRSDGRMAIAMHKAKLWDAGWSVNVAPDSSTAIWFWGSSNAYNEYLGAPDVPNMLDDWVHVTVTYSGYTGHIYINGRQSNQIRIGDNTSNTWISHAQDNTQPLSFGYTSSGAWDDGWSRPFQGAFDEFRLSGGAKSAAQIAAEYAAQMPNALAYSVGANDAGYAAVALANFTKSFSVTASGYTAGDTFDDFPMLVRLNPANIDGFSYGDFIQSDYSDIAFFDASGNPLAFDVDTWNASGESLVWVKVPSFAAGSVITCAYGGLMKNDIHQPATWSAYRGVWHLNETGDGVQAISDATANGMDGTSHAATAAVSGGQFGGSRRMATSRGPSDQNGGVRIPFNAAMNNNASGSFTMTASTWVNLDTGGNWGGALLMRKNGMDDGGWGFAYNYTEMNHFDYYFRESYDGIYTPHSDGGGGYTKYNAEESIWKTAGTSGEWHKYTVVYYWDGGKIICDQYLDGEKGDARWLYNFTDDGAGGSTGERSYAPLCQPTDKGLALGAYLGGGNYPLLGAMDETRLRFGETSSTRETAEYAQETDASYYAYSTVADVPGSTVPAVVVFGEAADATVANDTANGKVVFTIPVNVASVNGTATLRLMVGMAEPKDGDPADLMAVVDTMNVSAAGSCNFVWNGAVLGTKVAYKVVSEAVIDSTHTWTSETALKTATLQDPSVYKWIPNAKGLWSDSGNWTRSSAADNLPRLGYPSYGSQFNVYGDSQTSEIQVDANYENLASGSTLGWGGDDVTFRGVVDGAAIGYPEGEGFRDGQYSNVKIAFDNVALTCGSYHVYADSSLTMLDGAYLYTRWEFDVAGENAFLLVGDGCELHQRGVDGDRFQLSGRNASIVISNGVVKANTLRIGGRGDDDEAFVGRTPKGIFFQGASPQLQILQYAKVHADMGGELPVVFAIPETGYTATPIVKTGAADRSFAERKLSGIPGLAFSIDRTSPFYAHRTAPLEQTIVDWRHDGAASGIDADGLLLKTPRAGSWTLDAKVLSVSLDRFDPGLSIILR